MAGSRAAWQDMTENELDTKIKDTEKAQNINRVFARTKKQQDLVKAIDDVQNMRETELEIKRKKRSR